jgi:hypothetical protein
VFRTRGKQHQATLRANDSNEQFVQERKQDLMSARWHGQNIDFPIAELN